MSARLDLGRIAMTVGLAIAVLLPAGVDAQRRGGGGGGGMSAGAPSRMAVFTAAFTLEEAQKKQIKTILDAGYKDAAPLRAQLTKARTALAAAIQGGKNQAEIDEATKAYAAEATAMMQAETKALSQFMLALTEEQRANKTASQSALFMMRGVFAGKKWDMTPDVRFY